jgi:UDP-N-acetylmuramate dehydrogenase
VSAKHANFIVTEPGATAADVVALIEVVRTTVEAETGVRLEPEVRVVGELAG